MKSKLNWIFSVMMVLSMVLSACAGAVATTEAPAPVVEATATTAPKPTDVPEPTPTAIQPASEAAVDAAYSAWVGALKGYGVMKMDAFAEVMAEEAKPFLLDVRQPEEAEKAGHIEGAVFIPLRELGANLDKLPSFDTPIVSYCGSGWRCTIAMAALGALGWQDVKALKDNSFTGWVDAGYPVVEGIPADAAVLDAAEPDPSMVLTMEQMFSAIPEGWGGVTPEQLATSLTENKDLILIDVRPQTEIDENGMIEGAQIIPLEEFVALKADWPADKNAPIAVYCGSGHRSTIAMTILWTYGYTNVVSMKGGLAEWTKAGYPVLGGKAADPTSLLDAGFSSFLAGMVAYNTMSLDELNLALGEEPPPYLLDVRTTEEATDKGHIENAYLVPLADLAKNLNLLPAYDTPIVSYCGSGWRCTIAITYLGALGWTDLKALKGGSFGGWVDAGYPVVAGLPAEAEALNAVNPDPALVEVFDAVLSNMPKGYGGISAGDVALALTENPDYLVVDVRTAEERAKSGIIDAANQIAIPLEELIAQKANWPADKATPMIVYCGSGHRSTIAMSMLWAYGYSDVKSMQGGFTAYTDAGFPIAEAVAP